MGDTRGDQIATSALYGGNADYVESLYEQYLADPASVPICEPVLMESAVTSAYQGFTSEIRRLWSVDGRVLVENLQSIVVVN